MKLDFALADCELSKISDALVASGEPAVLLDNRLRVVFKTYGALGFIKKIRKGSNFAAMVPKSDIEALEALSPSEVVITELVSNGERISAVAVGGREYRIVIFRPIASELLNRVLFEYGEMSGYDRANKARMLGDDGRTNRFLKLVFGYADNLFSDEKPFFNASSVVRSVVREFSKNDFDIVINADFGARDYLAFGNDSALALIVAFAIASCHDAECASDISVAVVSREGEIVISVSGFGATFAEIGNAAKSDNPMSESELWIYTAKLISDYNLWDLSLSKRDNGIGAFELSLPALESGAEFGVRDIHSEFVELVVKWAVDK